MVERGVSDWGIRRLYQPPNDRWKTTRRDLIRDDKLGWHRLLDDLQEIAEGYPTWYGLIWLGLVPNDDRYRLAGRGRCRNSGPPVAVARALRPCHVIPHEIGHALRMNHTNCKDPSIKDDLEELTDIVPNGRTSNVGIDVYSCRTTPSGSGDLMSYCDPHWTSAITWEYLGLQILMGA